MGSASEKKSDSDARQEKGKVSKAWGVLLFGLIGATATTFATYYGVWGNRRLLNCEGVLIGSLLRMQSSSSWTKTTSNSNRGSFSEEAWKRYNRRMQEEYEEEMERVQRIRRMQSVFNRERNKFKRGYESWRENNPGGYQYIPRDDWYWKTDTSYRYQRTEYTSDPKNSRTNPMSHHYAVLGLDRSRASPYSDAEIKTAFRAKAMECHPDQNQDNKEAAEEKFKEVVKSYEAIKLERKNGIC